MDAEMKYRTIPASVLQKVTDATDVPGAKERLHVGDTVQLNSGGPLLLVLDIDADRVTAGRPGEELTLPRACFSYVRPYASAGNASPSV